MNWKRLLLGAILVLILVPVIGWVVLTLTVRKLSNPDFLVAQIENSLNCRAEINEATLDLYSQPASLSLIGIGIGPRDEYVEQGTPQADRPRLNASVYIDHVYLELETGPLFSQQLVVRNLEIERPQLDMRIYPDGSTSLDELLEDVRNDSNPDEEKPKDPDKPKDPSKSKEFTADDLAVSAIANRFAIDGMEIFATIEKSKTTIQIYDADIIATNVDIDPTNLAEHNSIDLDYNATVAVDSVVQNRRFVDLVFDGKGKIQPFEVESRELHPRLETKVTVIQDSYIDGLVLLDEIEDTLRELEEFGVEFGEALRLRGDFSEDTDIAFIAHRGRVELTSDFPVPIDQNMLILEEGSWVDSGANDHSFNVTFILSKTLTSEAEGSIRKFLTEEFGKEVADAFIKLLLDPVKQEDFIVIRVTSTGDMGDPEVTLHTKLGKIGGSKGLLEGLLKGGDSPDGDPLKDLEGEAKKLLEGLFGGDKKSDE